MAAATTSDEGGGAAATNQIKKGTTVKLWIMPNGPDPQADMEKALKPFTEKTGINVDVEVVDWGVQLDRIRNAAVSGEGPDVTQAGTTQVPFFAALGGFEDLVEARRRHRRREGLSGGRLEDDPGGRPGRHVGRAVVHRGARHLLPQGRPGEGRIDPATAFTDWDAFRNTLETIKEKVPAAVDRRSARPARRPSTSSTT